MNRHPGLLVYAIVALFGCTFAPLAVNGTLAVATGPSATVEASQVSPTSTLLRRVQGTIYYVHPSGDDANSGTRSAPWATPGYGSRQLQPGDTLVILGGRYVLSQYDEDIVTPPSGTADNWITIQGEEGNRPILAGADDLAMAIDLSGASYVRIDNLEITHDDQASGESVYFRDGIVIVEEPASHVILEDIYIHHIDEFGLNLQDVNDLQVINCRIEYCGFGAMGGPARAHGGWQNVRIQDCHLSYGGHYYQGGDGSDRPYDRPDGFGIEESTGPIEIVDTVAEHNYGDGLDSKAANTTIRRCIVANNSCDGVKLWGDNSRVENTLIYGRGDGDDTTTPWAAIVIGTTATDARFEIVPELHALFAMTPAQQHFTVASQGGKIHQAGGQVLDLHAHIMHAMHKRIETLKVGVELTQLGAPAVADGFLDGRPEFGLTRLHVREQAVGCG